MAQGVYHPGASPTDAFNIKNGVHHKGGFAGVTETNPDDNDPVAYPTVLSGDLAGDDSIGCALNDSGNSKHVVSAGSVSIATILERFVVTRGNAGGDQLKKLKKPSRARKWGAQTTHPPFFTSQTAQRPRATPNLAFVCARAP